MLLCMCRAPLPGQPPSRPRLAGRRALSAGLVLKRTQRLGRGTGQVAWREARALPGRAGGVIWALPSLPFPSPAEQCRAVAIPGTSPPARLCALAARPPARLARSLLGGPRLASTMASTFARALSARRSAGLLALVGTAGSLAAGGCFLLSRDSVGAAKAKRRLYPARYASTRSAAVRRQLGSTPGLRGCQGASPGKGTARRGGGGGGAGGIPMPAEPRPPQPSPAGDV